MARRVPHDADDPRTDLQLVEAINRGDPRAFECLYRRHRDWVVNLAYRFTGNRDTALDVMQEAFLHLLGRFPGFQLTARLTTFLYPVVKHLARDAVRKSGRQSTGLEAAPEPTTPATEPADDAHDSLRPVLASLSDEQREVILLRFADGFTLDEIAASIEVPLGTVKSRLHHAIRRLRSDPNVRKFFES